MPGSPLSTSTGWLGGGVAVAASVSLGSFAKYVYNYRWREWYEHEYEREYGKGQTIKRWWRPWWTIAVNYAFITAFYVTMLCVYLLM